VSGIQNKLSSQISNNANVNGSNWKIKVERSKLKKGTWIPPWLCKSLLDFDRIKRLDINLIFKFGPQSYNYSK
jgi:hypothetical protein